MQIPIIAGIYADTSPNYRTSFPINMRPVPKVQGISQGYLRIADGIVQDGTGPGIVRGGLEWEGVCYRVMGTKLVTVDGDGTVTELGDVGGSGTVSMTHSFDRLAIASKEKLYLWDKTALVLVTDPDLGPVLDVIWVDGYFMTTDGENLVVTELNDPTAVDPLKYGSSEVDPDPVNALVKLRNEVFAVNRNSIELFQNVGGAGFPFQVVRGAQVHRGSVGTHCAAVYREAIAFIGSGQNESPAVWLGTGGSSARISNQEIDDILMGYTEAELALVVMEVVTDRGHELLHIHLPDQTLVLDAAASEVLGQPAWHTLSSSILYEGQYLARHYVWAHEQWMVGDPTTDKVGHTSSTVATHWGEETNWRFATPIIYNESRSAQIHQLELVSLTGTIPFNDNPTVETQYSTDGVNWSQPKRISAGTTGGRNKRLRWLRQGLISDWRVQRFSGTSDTMLAVARLEAQLEPMAW